MSPSRTTTGVAPNARVTNLPTATPDRPAGTSNDVPTKRAGARVDTPEAREAVPAHGVHASKPVETLPLRGRPDGSTLTGLAAWIDMHGALAIVDPRGRLKTSES